MIGAIVNLLIIVAVFYVFTGRSVLKDIEKAKQIYENFKETGELNMDVGSKGRAQKPNKVREKAPEYKSFDSLALSIDSIKYEYSEIYVDTNSFGKVIIKIIKDSKEKTFYLYIGDLFVLNGKEDTEFWKVEYAESINNDIRRYISDAISRNEYVDSKYQGGYTALSKENVKFIFEGYAASVMN